MSQRKEKERHRRGGDGGGVERESEWRRYRTAARDIENTEERVLW